MSTLRFLAAALVFVMSEAVAQTQQAPNQGPGPLSKQFPCDAFVKKPDGSWVPNRDVNIELPDRGVITVGPAASFTPGKVALGPDVGSLIEQQCGSR
jgi:hypothetical protein